MSEHRDPAMEAALRAMGTAPDDLDPAALPLVLSAAREALAPIREEHQPITILVTSCEEACEKHEDECPNDTEVRVCGACWDLALDVNPYHGEEGIADVLIWPCDTARLIYPSKELK